MMGARSRAVDGIAETAVGEGAAEAVADTTEGAGEAAAEAVAAEVAVEAAKAVGAAAVRCTNHLFFDFLDLCLEPQLPAFL